MGASDQLENSIITRLIDGNSYLMSPDATYYASLHTADPGDTGINELTATNGYARKSYTTSGGWNAAASGSTSNSGSITFAAASGGDWAQATHFGLWNHATNTAPANFILYGTLTSAVTCTDGDAVQFLGGSPGAFVITVE